MAVNPLADGDAGSMDGGLRVTAEAFERLFGLASLYRYALVDGLWIS